MGNQIVPSKCCSREHQIGNVPTMQELVTTVVDNRNIRLGDSDYLRQQIEKHKRKVQTKRIPSNGQVVVNPPAPIEQPRLFNNEEVKQHNIQSQHVMIEKYSNSPRQRDKSVSVHIDNKKQILHTGTLNAGLHNPNSLNPA